MIYIILYNNNVVLIKQIFYYKKNKYICFIITVIENNFLLDHC